jgi:hypothetical protein
MVIMICCVLGTELTLWWNGVLDVYEVSSTGQVIPLLVGLGMLASVIWKIARKENVRSTIELILSLCLTNSGEPECARPVSNTTNRFSAT